MYKLEKGNRDHRISQWVKISTYNLQRTQKLGQVLGDDSSGVHRDTGQTMGQNRKPTRGELKGTKVMACGSMWR